MKIAILISNLRFGGAEVQTVELANNLAASGNEILLMSMDNDLAIRERVAAGIEVVALGKRSYVDFRLFRKIIGLLRDFKPNCLLMVNTYPTMYGYLASFFSGRRFGMISIQHTTLFNGLVDELQNLYYMKMVNRMDRIVFVCNNQRDYWIRKYGINPRKSVVIYNGINVSRFEAFQTDAAKLRSQLGFSPTDIVIGVNANLRPEKKHEDLIDALKILQARGYPVKLLFIGDGVRRSFLERHIEARGLREDIVISGFVQDVRPYLYCVDISALSSVAVETLSIAIIESMALAKPIVISNIGGASELVEHGRNGFLYEAGNVGQLADAIAAIIDGKLFVQMGEKSLQKAKELFDTGNMTVKYTGILKELC